MEIIDPTQGRPDRAAEVRVRVDDIGSRLSGRVCTLSNAKPNASELLAGVAAAIGPLQRAATFVKPSSAIPAPAELLERIAADFDAVLVAIGD